jgi:predicted anti-sigma-YlaC factor YlaD
MGASESHPEEEVMSTVSYRRHEHVPARRLAAVSAVLGLVALGLFQLTLALGAPLGHAAWGGESASLSSAQRLGSAVSVVLYAAGAVVILARAGLTPRPRNRSLLRWGPWVLTLVFALGAIANFASSSRWENFTLGPSAALLAGLCALIARTPLQSG